MDESEAVKAAQAFLKRKEHRSLQFQSVQKVVASDLPHRLQDCGDFWVVRFQTIVSDEVVESPGTLLLNVNDSTGEVTLFDSL